jgi:hypothetical protein
VLTLMFPAPRLHPCFLPNIEDARALILLVPTRRQLHALVHVPQIHGRTEDPVVHSISVVYSSCMKFSNVDPVAQ